MDKPPQRRRVVRVSTDKQQRIILIEMGETTYEVTREALFLLCMTMCTAIGSLLYLLLRVGQ